MDSMSTISSPSESRVSTSLGYSSSNVEESNNLEEIPDSFEHVDTSTDMDDIVDETASEDEIEQNFKQSAKMWNSTTIKASPLHTPNVKPTTKRSLNCSTETPRIIKKVSEAKTPTFASFVSKEYDSIINTPRNVPQISSRSPSPESDRSLLLVESSDDDVINVSSEVEATVSVFPKKGLVQPKLNQFFKEEVLAVKKEPQTIDTDLMPIKTSVTEYNYQRSKIKHLEEDLLKAQNGLRIINMEHLPDKGQSLKEKYSNLENALEEAKRKFAAMEVCQDADDSSCNIVSWEELEKNADLVQPTHFGKRGMNTYTTQKALTMDRLQELHSSLETCPKEADLTEAPKGVKIELMQHQKRALTWLLWREKQTPSGGILADDMGLGKTLTMISLIMKSRELEEDDDSNDENDDLTKYRGGTLIICPASLISQWSQEIDNRTKRGLLSYEMYHGPKREKKAKRLAKYDMVITTYGIVSQESVEGAKNNTIFGIKWRRIILDEAHQIRNHKSKTSVSVCILDAQSRWALTGTPVHNKEMDMYALINFLRCPPFNELAIWKRWVGDKSQGGQDRMHTIISSLMLRRTKQELSNKGTLQALPERIYQQIEVKLSEDETNVYQKILIFSRTLFAQFLHQRADKQDDEAFTEEVFKMRKLLLHSNNIRDVKQHEILVLLLRLRQICCHSSLITGMLQDEDQEYLGFDENESDTKENVDFLQQLDNLKLEDNFDPTVEGEAFAGEECSLKDAAKGILNPSNPVFSKQKMSSKIRALLKVLKEDIADEDKVIIVSQWRTFLQLIAIHLDSEDIAYEQLDGCVPVSKRKDIIEKINNSRDPTKVLLLSLTAGGVGLNLVGANHLFLMDLHWNPQLENQAQDRIYRMGQKKTVYVYKFLVAETIEERIFKLQQQKLALAEGMLTGSKQVISSKLTLEDLKMLFGVQT